MTWSTMPHWKSRSAKAARTSRGWSRSGRVSTTAGLAIGSTDPKVLARAPVASEKERTPVRTNVAAFMILPSFRRARVGRSGAAAEALGVAGAGEGRRLLAIARRSRRDQVPHQAPGGRRDLLHRPVEGRRVGLRGRVEAAQLAHELERGRADLLVRRGRIEVEQGADASAHGPIVWRKRARSRAAPAAPRPSRPRRAPRRRRGRAG